MWSNSRHKFASVLWNGLFFVPKNEQDMEKYMRTLIQFSQLKGKAYLEIMWRCFQDHVHVPAGPGAWMLLSPSKAFPTSSGLFGLKGPRTILPSSLSPHHVSFCYWMLCLKQFLLSSWELGDTDSHRCWGLIIIPRFFPKVINLISSYLN